MNIRKIIGVVLAAMLALGSTAAYAADANMAQTRETSEAKEKVLYTYKYADVKASAAVGGTALPDDKVVLDASDGTVTVVVPDGNSETVSVTVTTPASTNPDIGTLTLTGTAENARTGDNVVLMDGETNAGIRFSVYLAEQSKYVPHTISITAKGCSHIEDEHYSINYMLTTEKTQAFGYISDYTSLLVHGDEVLPGTKVYMCLDDNLRKCYCEAKIELYDPETKKTVDFMQTQTEYADGRRIYHMYFIMPDHPVVYNETHTQTYKARCEVINRDYGVAKDKWGNEINASTTYLTKGTVREFIIIPDEGYDAVVTAEDSEGSAVAVTKGEDNKYSFEMPAKDVLFKVEFVKKSTTEPEQPPVSSSSSSSEPEQSPVSSSSSSSEPEQPPVSSSSSSSLPEQPPVSSSSSEPDGNVTQPDKVTDKDTGITVEADKGTFDRETVLVVTPMNTVITDGESSLAFDIKFLADSTEVQPGKPVTVKIPVPATLAGKTLYVYHVDANGNYTDMNAEIKDGMVVFTADHFSIYIVTDLKHSPSDTAVKPDGSAGSNPSNPSTGTALAFVPVLLAAGAFAALFSQKKK